MSVIFKNKTYQVSQTHAATIQSAYRELMGAWGDGNAGLHQLLIAACNQAGVPVRSTKEATLVGEQV